MVELSDQQALVILGFSAFGHIDVDTSHALGATGMVIGNEASSFDPPEFTSRYNKAKLVDEFMPPFLERADLFGAQALHIVSMHAREPSLGGDFHGGVRETVDRCAGARNPHGSCGDVVGIRANARGSVCKVELRSAFGQHLPKPFALGNVDVDADYALRGSIGVIGNETPRLDPSNLTVGTNDTILDVVFGPPLAKSSHTRILYPSEIPWMRSGLPFTAGCLHCPSRQAVHRRVPLGNLHPICADIIRIATDERGLSGQREL